MSDKTIIIDDEYGIVGNIILSIIKENAANSGFDLFSCYCPTKPKTKLESIIIPELNISFAVSKSYHNINDLEKLYSSCMDYNKVNHITEKLINDILK